jgi:hypothetical protein
MDDFGKDLSRAILWLAVAFLLVGIAFGAAGAGLLVSCSHQGG